MVLSKLPVPGRLTIRMTLGQGPIVLAVGARGGCLDIFTLVCPFSPLSPSLGEMARCRLRSHSEYVESYQIIQLVVNPRTL